jgi:HlyD family secretion protein
MVRRIPIVLVLLALVTAAVWWLRADHGPPHYTGFVEGEERVVRSEVTGRVLEVPFREGDTVPAGAIVARLDDRDIAARIAAKRAEMQVIDAEIERQQEQVALTDSTWRRELRAREADVRQAAASAELARRTFAREQELVRTGASTAQQLDDARAQRDQAVSALERARELLGKTQAEQRSITLARQQADVLRQQRERAGAELAELEVTRSKFAIHAPAVPTVVQTQLIWPGELAQPGTAIVSVLDPTDKYVQVYVPVADTDRFRVGRRVEIELDSEPGRRVPGEVTFVADSANFTPEKIETRSDRMGQVYRAKVRILEGVERFQPGTEGNVYLVDEARGQADPPDRVAR